MVDGKIDISCDSSKKVGFGDNKIMDLLVSENYYIFLIVFPPFHFSTNISFLFLWPK